MPQEGRISLCDDSWSNVEGRLHVQIYASGPVLHLRGIADLHDRCRFSLPSSMNEAIPDYKMLPVTPCFDAPLVSSGNRPIGVATRDPGAPDDGHVALRPFYEYEIGSVADLDRAAIMKARCASGIAGYQGP